MGSLDKPAKLSQQRGKLKSQQREHGFKNLPSFPHSTPCFPCTLPFLWTSFKRMSLRPRLPWIQANHLRGPRTQFPLHLPNLWQISLVEGTGATMVRVAPIVYQAKTAQQARIVGPADAC